LLQIVSNGKSNDITTGGRVVLKGRITVLTHPSLRLSVRPSRNVKSFPSRKTFLLCSFDVDFMFVQNIFTPNSREIEVSQVCFLNVVCALTRQTDNLCHVVCVTFGWCICCIYTNQLLVHFAVDAAYASDTRRLCSCSCQYYE